MLSKNHATNDNDKKFTFSFLYHDSPDLDKDLKMNIL